MGKRTETSVKRTHRGRISGARVLMLDSEAAATSRAERMMKRVLLEGNEQGKRGGRYPSGGRWGLGGDASGEEGGIVGTPHLL